MRNTISICIFALFGFLCFACNQTHSLYDQLDHKSQIKLKINNLVFDSVVFDASQTSQVGDWFCFQNKLYFGDHALSSIYGFDTTFQLHSRKLGLGHGPKEIPTRAERFIMNDDLNLLFIMGSSFDIFIVDKLDNVRSYRLQDFDLEGIPMATLTNDPKPSNKGIYEVDYDCLDAQLLSKNTVLLPISTSHPLLNAYTSRVFYRETSTLGLFDLNTGKLIKMFGRHSPVYEKYNFIPQFQHPIFTRRNDELLVSYEADSLIYSYKIGDWDKINFAFGNAGHHLNLNYTEVQSFTNPYEVFDKDRPTCGYYRKLKYIKSRDLLFRSYQKGGSQTTDGLQIYKGETLIGDVEVPVGFEVIGYIDPYFYGVNTFDQFSQRDLQDDDFTFTIYKFKLNE